MDIYTLPCVKHVARGNVLYSTRSSALCSVMTWKCGIGGKEGGARGKGYIYIYMADSCCCMEETNTL